jgi:hypothetical protein
MTKRWQKEDPLERQMLKVDEFVELFAIWDGRVVRGTRARRDDGGNAGRQAFEPGEVGA